MESGSRRPEHDGRHHGHIQSNRGVQGALGMQVSKHRSSRCEHGMVTSTLEHVASTHRQLKVRYRKNNMWMLM